MATANNAAAAKFTTDHRFTGQKQDGSGLTFMNARYYDPSIGTFISPDTIVPDAGNVFDYNRFMYVRGRVMNATDPSGHFTNDEILSSLTKKFGSTEGWIIFQHWQEFDSHWMESLHFAEYGSTLWASELEGIGFFFQGENGQIQIQWSSGGSPKNLHDLQGKGGYQVNKNGEISDPGICDVTCYQAIYEYDERGIKGNGTLRYASVGSRSIEFVRTAKMPWTETKLQLLSPWALTKFVKAPALPTGSGTLSVLENAAGLFEEFPMIGANQLLVSIAEVVSPLYVVTYTPIPPSPYDNKRGSGGPGSCDICDD